MPPDSCYHDWQDEVSDYGKAPPPPFLLLFLSVGSGGASTIIIRIIGCESEVVFLGIIGDGLGCDKFVVARDVDKQGEGGYQP
jgi:hypothetical protein